VDAGVRADFSGYDYETHLDPLATGAHRRPASTTVSYTHVSPKLGATYEVNQRLNLFGSYRHGFRAPTQGQLFQQNSAANTIDLEPVKVDSYEAGVRGQLGSRFVYQLSAYDMIIRDDIITFVTSANTREATNAGKTRHRGIEASTGVALRADTRLDVAYAVSNQKYVEWTPQAATGTTPAVTYSRNFIEQAPRDLASVVLTWSPRLLRTGRVAAEWTHTGRYAQDPANTAFYSGYELLNIHANAFVRGSTEIFGRIVNVADRKFAELVSYDRFQGGQYTPGTPRSVYLGVRHAW
jgi:outer membrane receptor protein involved in Fe transport